MGRIARLLGSLSCAAALSLAPQIARAQGETPDALGVSIVHNLFGAVDLKALITKSLGNMPASLGEILKARPTWGPLMMETMGDEFVNDRPEIEALLGHRLAVVLSPDELKTGAQIMADPGILALVAAASGTPTSGAGAAPSAAAMRLAQTPAGMSFVAKLGKQDTMMDPATTREMVAIILPGWFQRFGKQAAAQEHAKP
jgi:hypothetical protein